MRRWYANRETEADVTLLGPEYDRRGAARG